MAFQDAREIEISRRFCELLPLSTTTGESGELMRLSCRPIPGPRTREYQFQMKPVDVAPRTNSQPASKQANCRGGRGQRD